MSFVPLGEKVPKVPPVMVVAFVTTMVNVREYLSEAVAVVTVLVPMVMAAVDTVLVVVVVGVVDKLVAADM